MSALGEYSEVKRAYTLKGLVFGYPCKVTLRNHTQSIISCTVNDSSHNYKEKATWNMLGNYLGCTHRSQLEVEIDRTPKAHFTTQQFIIKPGQQFIIKPGQQSTPSLFSRHCTVHFKNVTNTDDKFSITIDAAVHSAIVLTDKHFHGDARLHVKLLCCR
jgi:hypothetical protein